MNVAALTPLAEQAIINRLLSKKTPFRRKNKFGVGLAILSGLLFFVALVYAIYAGYGWLLTSYTQPEAALIVAVGVALVAALSGLSGFLLLKKKPRPDPMAQDDIMGMVTEIGELLGDELAEPIQNNPKTAMVLAGLAGFIAGDHLH